MQLTQVLYCATIEMYFSMFSPIITKCHATRMHLYSVGHKNETYFFDNSDIDIDRFS